MGWRRPWRAGVVATAIAAGVLASVPATATGADADEPFPLPGGTPSAIAVDVDGDGARELVRLTGSDAPVRLEVWDLIEGRWATTFSAEIDALPGSSRELDGLAARALVRTQVDGLDRALLLIGGSASDSGTSGCCLAVHELVGDGSGPELRRVPVPDLAADSIVIADLDGDGTDELVASLINWSEDGLRSSTDVAVLTRDGDAWSTLAAWEEPGAWWVMNPVETDGAPGTELVATGETRDMARVAWVDGAIEIERAGIATDNEPAWVAGSVDGNLIVTASTSVSLLRWPRDGRPTMLASHETGDYPTVGVIGSGADALIVVQEHTARGAIGPATHVLDAGLRPIGEVPATATATALGEVAERLSSVGWNGSPPTNIWPYFGPDDGEWGDGATSYVVGGMRVTSAPGGSFETSPSAALVGRPNGRIGPDGGWVVVGDAYLSSGAITQLYAGFPYGGTRLTIVPLATFQDPADRTIATSIEIDRGVITGESGAATTLLAGPTGADIVVGVVPGTVAVSSDGSLVTDHGEVDGELRIAVDPPSRPRPGREYSFERDLVLVGPDGTATVHRWEGTFFLEAPDLTAWTDLDTMSLEATVAGRAAPLSVVTVDGEPVALNEFGAYRATVSAPPWPRNVVVVARDPFGSEQRTTVQVIGLVDYRGLPWGPIAGVVTVLVGGVFFLRTPRRRPAPQRTPLDDGRLEDLDGDVI